jgi:PAS domain S-box-containing protein
MGAFVDHFNPEGFSSRAEPDQQQDGSAYLLQVLLDAMPFPFFYKDPQGRFLGCNRAFEISRGQTREELLGKTVFHFLPLNEARRLNLKDLELLRTGGNESFAEAVSSPTRGIRQIMVHKATFKHADGEVAGIATTVMDVTEQKAAEAALRQSQDLLSTISSNMTDLVAIVDPEGRRLYSSPSYSSVLGYSKAELNGDDPLAIVHPEDRYRIREALANVFGRGVKQKVEYRLRHKDGTWLYFESKANPICQPSGQPSEALILARDVTDHKAAELERQQMEIQLRHAQKLESIGSLAAGIAHEINTPIQYIGDNTSFLGSTMPDLLACLAAQRQFLADLEARQALAPEAARNLAMIQQLDLDYLAEEIPKAIRQTLDGVARVAAIVSAMKDFSHPGGEGKSLTNLNKAIESTLAVSRNEWKYVAQVESDLDPALPPVPCLQGEINQAVLNLVVNAAHAIEESLGGRHTGKLGIIKVATRRVGRDVRISVSDNGKGIPEAIRDRIFEPFFTTKPVGKGTGQGLAIVHAVVVEKHAGRVEVESQIGLGTTFHLFLPLGPDDQA